MPRVEGWERTDNEEEHIAAEWRSTTAALVNEDTGEELETSYDVYIRVVECIPREDTSKITDEDSEPRTFWRVKMCEEVENSDKIEVPLESFQYKPGAMDYARHWVKGHTEIESEVVV